MHVMNPGDGVEGPLYFLVFSKWSLDSVPWDHIMPDAGLIIRVMIILGTAQISFLSRLPYHKKTDFPRTGEIGIVYGESCIPKYHN